MKRTFWRLGEILIQKDWVTWDQLGQALAIQYVHRRPLGEIFIEKGLLSHRNLFRALAIQRGIPFIDLREAIIEPSAARSIPRWLAKMHRVMPLERGKEILIVAVGNPSNLWSRAVLQEYTGIQDIRYVLCCPDDIDWAINRHYQKPQAA